MGKILSLAILLQVTIRIFLQCVQSVYTCGRHNLTMLLLFEVMKNLENLTMATCTWKCEFIAQE